MGNTSGLIEPKRPESQEKEEELHGRDLPEASRSGSTIEGPSGEPLNIQVYGEENAQVPREDDRSCFTGSSGAGSSSGYTLPQASWASNLVGLQPFPMNPPSPPPMTAAEAEAELRRRSMEIAHLQRQVELLQGEVAMPAPTGLTPSMVRQAQVLISAFGPEMPTMEDVEVEGLSITW
eukprot:symbB.v1.2.022227.t1/scaffold1961.1/size94642/3